MKLKALNNNAIAVLGGLVVFIVFHTFSKKLLCGCFVNGDFY